MTDIEKETITTRRITVVFNRQEVEEIMRRYAQSLIENEEFPLGMQREVKFHCNGREDHLSGVTVVLQTIKRDDG